MKNSCVKLGLLRTSLASLLVLAACHAGLAWAEDAPDAKQILQAADEATLAVRAVSYRAEFFGQGGLAPRTPHLKGRVKGRQRRRSLLDQFFGRSGSPNRELANYEHLLRITGERLPTAGGAAVQFDVATDARQVFSLDHARRLYEFGDFSTAHPLLKPAVHLYMIEFFHPTPFQDERGAKTARYEGVVEVEGIACDVVYVEYRQRAPDARWFFGREDSLPRRVERIFDRFGTKGATVLIVADLEISPDLDQDMFTPRCPRRFTRRKYLLPLGAEAPGWSLTTPDGRCIRLKDLRGNVVVMDFWTIRCAGCKKSMPQTDRIYNRFKDKPVMVFGLNCWEKEDAAAYFASLDFDYPMLLNADETAEDYCIPGTPTYYVIDPQGRVAYAVTGIVEDRESELSRVIESLLRKQPEPAKPSDTSREPSGSARD